MMRHSAAFFDVDETLINIKSMFDFYEFWCLKTNATDKVEVLKSDDGVDGNTPKSREDLNRSYYRRYKGVYYEDLLSYGREWFHGKKSSNIFNHKIVNILQNHQRDGITPVFVSGSMEPILRPVASYLNVSDILSVQLEVDSNGICTGEIGYPQTIGKGKSVAVRNYCDKNQIDPRDCFAYGDDPSDVPMLETVGHPHCVGQSPALNAIASKRNWKLINLTE